MTAAEAEESTSQAFAVEIRVWNLSEQARNCDAVMTEVMVDTSYSRVYLWTAVINQLGLRPRIPVGNARLLPVKLEMGRSGTFDVTEVPDELPNRIGHIPLTYMDWVIDEKRSCLMGNPDHGDQWIDEAFIDESVSRFAPRCVGPTAPRYHSPGQRSGFHVATVSALKGRDTRCVAASGLADLTSYPGRYRGLWYGRTFGALR